MSSTAARLLRLLVRNERTVAVAESFTGGLVQHQLTEVPGASRAFLGGIVAYDDRLKRRSLGVRSADLKEHGAVSEPVVLAMARGIRDRVGATIGIATTGIAGPTGATKTKPVGLSMWAVSTPDGDWVEQRIIKGTRTKVKARATEQALRLALLHAGPQPLKRRAGSRRP